MVASASLANNNEAKARDKFELKSFRPLLLSPVVVAEKSYQTPRCFASMKSSRFFNGPAQMPFGCATYLAMNLPFFSGSSVLAV